MPSEGPRVLFLGSPAFALPSLRALRAVVPIVGVVTQPDRPAGRGRRLEPTPVAAYARQAGLPLFQPLRLRAPETLAALRATRPDLIVTVAYGRIVPPELLALPPLGAVNAHPSLLPRYRGASPIQHAIKHGERETGVTIHYQTEALDAGDIILQERVPIAPDDTAATLEARLAEVAARLLVKAVRLIAEGRAPRTPQDESQATYVGRLTKADGRIDWTQPAAAIANLVRAMDPWPSAYTWREGRLLKVWRAEPLPAPPAARMEPGTVLAVDGEGILVATGDGLLRVREVQPEGGRRMGAAEYARGHPVRVGERWGAPEGVAPEGVW